MINKKRIIEELKNYNPVIKSEENNFCRIAIDNLFVDLDDEITVVFEEWHMHYSEEDCEEAIEKVKDIINNNECILVIYCNDKIFGCGSSLKKDKYTEKDVLEFLNSFFQTNNSSFKEHGAVIKVKYFDSTKNYDLYLDKESFC
ncbi:MAG: hypothetical protein IKE63_02900 [Bacilli bacterium]|nr:hypothetical protein [Bacilli bacterium]